MNLKTRPVQMFTSGIASFYKQTHKHERKNQEKRSMNVFLYMYIITFVIIIITKHPLKITNHQSQMQSEAIVS